MFFLKRKKNKELEANSNEVERPKEVNIDKLLDYFHSLEGIKEFPYTLAVESIENLHKTSNSKYEFMTFVLEDSVFASLYATFYEKLFMSILRGPSVTLQLIDHFSEHYEEREQLIAKQAHLHVEYIQNGGNCNGCVCCDNHKDVAELVNYWHKKDMDFFIELFVGMQTIQYTLENIVYDLIPNEPEIVSTLFSENVLAFRKYLFNYSTSQLRQ